MMLSSNLDWCRTYFSAALFVALVLPLTSFAGPEVGPIANCTAALSKTQPRRVTSYLNHYTDGFYFLRDIHGLVNLRKEARMTMENVDRTISSVLQFRHEWADVSLNWAIYKFLGPDVRANISPSGRKIIYTSIDPNVPYEIVDDPVGHYFRIQLWSVDSGDPNEYQYVDINGRSFDKPLPQGTSQKDFLARTHFNYAFELNEATIEEILYFPDKSIHDSKMMGYLRRLLHPPKPLKLKRASGRESRREKRLRKRLEANVESQG